MYDFTSNFAKVFKVSDPEVKSKLEANFMSIMSTEEGISKLREGLAKDGISIDGLIFDAGNAGVISRTGSIKTSGEIPGAVTRIENIETLNHDIVLQPAFKQKYTLPYLGEDKQADYFVYILPNAPDLHDLPPITQKDIELTVRVLKASGKEHHLWDLRESNFVFLKGPDGKVISYPSGESIPEDFRGKPIAFIRDLNAISATKEFGKKEVGNENAETWLAADVLEKLEPAPQACVEACKQQYALTQKLVDNLRAGGIEPTHLPPVGKWQQGVKGRIELPVLGNSR